MHSPGQVVSREDISENVLGRKFHPFDRSLDMHVSRLRRKLSETDATEEQVKQFAGWLPTCGQLGSAGDKGLKDARLFLRYLSFFWIAQSLIFVISTALMCVIISKARKR